MKIENDMKLDFNNVLIRPKRSTISSRSQVDLEREFVFPYSTKTWKGVPIIAANMDTIGTFEVYQELSKHKIITCFHKFYTAEDFKEYLENNTLDKNYYMISTGISDSDFERLEQIMDVLDSDFICIDIANGYLETLIIFCQKVRFKYPDKIIVAGNVVSREMVEELIINGKVDIVKTGIGSGAACITRLKTGIGMPQLSCVIECADAAHGVNGFIISDGGITCPADMCKAFGGGADFVMCGGIFSGHDENPGDLIEENGQKYKLFYGMSSDLAMKKHYGKMANYRASEGRILKVKYRGKLENTVLDYLGGVRSCCTYINAKKIKNIPKCTTFVLVSQQLNTSLVV
jgi:GMP reductase